jgi:hypothetical protein
MKLHQFTRLWIIAPAMVAASMAMTAKADTLSDECFELGGEYDEPYCTVITETETPFSIMTRPAGDSGLGWTAIGIDVEHTTDIYIIDSEIEEQSVWVEGDPSASGCDASGDKPKKCTGYWKNDDVEVFFWTLDETSTWTERTMTACYNPGDRLMGDHKHCAL